MEFVQGNIAEEKVFGGAVFPKTLLPPCETTNNSTTELAQMVKAKREWLSELLQRHSAILFRGFLVSSPKEFQRVVEAFGWEDMPYMGGATRLKVADRVYTANEVAIDKLINFHHEMSLFKQFPSKLFFFCLQPSPSGGETSILPRHILVEKMEKRVPEVIQKLSEIGFTFRKWSAKEENSTNVVSKTWQSYLETEDQAEAEQRAKEKLGCNSVEFTEDGRMEFVFGPMNPIREIAGKRVWFNTIVGYTSDGKDFSTCYGDGSCFPSTATDAYQKTIGEICVDIKWQKGDVLLVDNSSVQHARRPGQPPRVLFVSICK